MENYFDRRVLSHEAQLEEIRRILVSVADWIASDAIMKERMQHLDVLRSSHREIKREMARLDVVEKVSVGTTVLWALWLLKFKMIAEDMVSPKDKGHIHYKTKFWFTAFAALDYLSFFMNDEMSLGRPISIGDIGPILLKDIIDYEIEGIEVLAEIAGDHNVQRRH